MKRLDLRELTKRFMNKEMLSAPTVKDNAQTALVGLAILVSGLFFRADALGSFREIEAEVTKIEYVSEDRLTETSDARVYVSYTVDGKEYRDIRCNKHGSDVRVGDLVRIEYNTADASKIRTFSDMLLPYAIFLGGGVVFAVGLWLTSLDLMALDPEDFEKSDEKID